MAFHLPKISVRAFTDDQSVLDKCFYSNNYQLKGTKDSSNGPVIVDIGAHVGYFTFTALAMGAKKVYSVEPYIENFKMLLDCDLDALERSDRAVPYYLGIYPFEAVFKFNHPEITDGIYYNFSNIDIESDKASGCRNQVIKLDSFLNDYVIETTVDVLKISIGYSEIEILEGASLDKVISICGETDEELERIEQFKEMMAQKGFINFVLTKGDGESRNVFFASKGDINKHFNVQK